MKIRSNEELNKLENEGIKFFNNKKYETAIEYFDKVLEIQPKNVRAINYKTSALIYLNDYDESIKYADKALSIYNRNTVALNNKAISLNYLKKYNESKILSDKVLSLKPQDRLALLNKAITLTHLNKFEEANLYADKLLKTEPNNVNALLNKAINFTNLGEYEKAIAYSEKVLKYNHKNKAALENRGVALSLLDRDNNIKESAEYFIKKKQTPLQILNQLKEIQDKEKLEHIIKTMIDDDNFFLSAIKTDNSEEEKKKEIYKDIYYHSLCVVSQLHVTGIKDFFYEQKVAHYANKNTSYILLANANEDKNKDNESSIRQFSIASTNDPKEGETLFDFLGINKCLTNDTDLEIKNNYQAFITCFSFNKQSLNQFRLYGKECNCEGTGVSLVVNNNFFDDEIGIAPELSALDTASSDEKGTNNTTKKLSLFRCIYIDPETRKLISVGQREEYEIYRDIIAKNEKLEDHETEINQYKTAITEKLEQVRRSLKALKDKIEKYEDLDMNVVKELLIMLRYLVKHVAFKEEQECRILRIAQITDDDVKVEDGRMFIDYLPINNAVEEIYLGPIFQDATLYRDIIHRKCSDIKIYSCNHPFFCKENNNK